MSGPTLKLIASDPARLARFVKRFGSRVYHTVRTRGAPEYSNPSNQELEEIEHRCNDLGMPCHDFIVDPDDFHSFFNDAGFPDDYHGGLASGVYLEKVLEHYVAWKFLRLGNSFRGSYLDVAACSSPWARLLRGNGVDAFAIDLSVPPEHSDLAYYRQEDATRTSFKDYSIEGASLQCAYEMFVGTHDMDLVRELARILKPGGRVVILPLYTHTHPCYYQTPEHYGKPYGDEGAKAYVRHRFWGIPCSRKYSPETLKARVWDNAIQHGFLPSLHVLRNKREISEEIYLNFILVLDKSA